MILRVVVNLDADRKRRTAPAGIRNPVLSNVTRWLQASVWTCSLHGFTVTVIVQTSDHENLVSKLCHLSPVSSRLCHISYDYVVIVRYIPEVKQDDGVMFTPINT
jgi:hypothetical protein